MDENKARNLTDEQILGIRQELGDVERRVRRTLEPGIRGVVVAVAVLVLIAATITPYAGTASGWDVFLFDATAKAEAVTLPLRLFVWVCVIFGMVGSVSALITRRWVLAWVACLGCGLATFLGLLAVWSRQTLLVGQAGGGPGVGLYISWAVVAVLTYQWMRLVWSRAGNLPR